MPILMKNKSEVQLLKKPEVQQKRAEIIDSLIEVHSGLLIQSSSPRPSKYSLMNAIGKLLTLIRTTKMIDWGMVKGYITNVIRNNQEYVSIDTIEALNTSIGLLEDLRNMTEGLPWLKIVDGIDYEVFFLAFKSDVKGKRDFINNKFREFLKKKFKEDFEEIQNVLDVSDISKMEDVPSPFEVSNKELVDEFWKSYNKKKNKNEE
ncbi:MAG: hypothetical protein JW891_04185 [Candidatus Lokiarchaeota archaeon]|nr:hypothetical protein [Candidatus Lokiarchaeota archaeon]